MKPKAVGLVGPSAASSEALVLLVVAEESGFYLVSGTIDTSQHSPICFLI